MKRIVTQSGFAFLINSETGNWGISREDKEEVLENKLRNEIKPNKEYAGTNLYVLNSSNLCTLGCVYCSERMHRQSCKPMSFEVAQKTIDMALDGDRKPRIVFHGSEPLMSFDFMQRVVDYGVRKAEDKMKEISFGVQTSLAYIPDGFFDFISKYKVSVSTSLDGLRDVHDKTRPYLNGSGSFDDVIRNMKEVMRIQGGMNVTTVISKLNLESLSNTQALLENEGITSWQFLPVERNYSLSPNPIELGRQYLSLFESAFRRLERKEQKIELRTLGQYLSSFFYSNGIDACRTCSSGNLHPLLAIDSEGDVYPCDYFWGMWGFAAGNVFTDSANSLNNHPRNLRLRNINNTPCKSCTWKNNCGGGCLASAHFSKNGKTEYCQTHKMVYPYLAKKMPELIEKDLIKPILMLTYK